MKEFLRHKFLGLCIAIITSLLFASPVLASTTQNYLMWQMPTKPVAFPVYIYSNGTQVDYLYGPTQQAFVGPYSSQTKGTYQLYYQGDGTWHSCTLTLAQGVIDSINTTCPGAVVNKPVSIKLDDRTVTSNVYTVALGAIEWPGKSAPKDPQQTKYDDRTITFMNDTQYPTLQVGEVCTVSKNPSNSDCVNTQNLLQIKKGSEKVFTIGEKGLDSYAFTITAYETATGSWVKTGGYGIGERPYATKVEGTTKKVITKNGVEIPKGATNIDVSAVDGYNMGVQVYPMPGQYCTYTVPPENSNLLGADYYSQTQPLAKLEGNLSQICQNSSQLPSGQSGTAWNLSLKSLDGKFQGCMNPCTYAKKNSSPQANLFCCTGQYQGGPETCDQPAGKLGANNSTYVTNLKPPVSTNIYRFAYDDAIGDHACPADTNFIVKFVSQ